MKSKINYWEKIQLLYGLRLSLQRYRSSKKLHDHLKQYIDDNHKLNISYSQLNRYLQGIAEIPSRKINIIRSFLLKEIDPSKDLILPGISVDVEANPLQIDLTNLLNSHSVMNFLSYFLCHQQGLYGNYDTILTHLEALPLAISFSQALDIPWYSVTFRSPLSDPEQIAQYPYFIDREHVSTVYFTRKDLYKKRVIIISDYIRKGGLLDTLFRVVDDNGGITSYLIAIIGIGSIWKRFSTELGGKLTVLSIYGDQT